jgi:hypothetical protein
MLNQYTIFDIAVINDIAVPKYKLALTSDDNGRNND